MYSFLHCQWKLNPIPFDVKSSTHLFDHELLKSECNFLSRCCSSVDLMMTIESTYWLVRRWLVRPICARKVLVQLGQVMSTYLHLISSPAVFSPLSFEYEDDASVLVFAHMSLEPESRSADLAAELTGYSSARVWHSVLPCRSLIIQAL